MLPGAASQRSRRTPRGHPIYRIGGRLYVHRLSPTSGLGTTALNCPLKRGNSNQVIPPADGGNETPLGPHTHLQPELLATHGTHQETIPIPEGWVPGLTVYPQHPLHDLQGRPRPFDRRAHQAFQELLAPHGAADYLAEKARITRAVLAGDPPASFPPTSHRLACRIALRQLPCLHNRLADFDAWSAAFDCD